MKMRYRRKLRQLLVSKNIIWVICFCCIGYIMLLKRSENDDVVFSTVDSSTINLSPFLLSDLGQTFQIDEENVHMTKDENLDVACRMPNLDANNPSVNKYFHSVPPLNCGGTQDWVFIHNGTLCISKDTWRIHGGIKCDYYPIFRVDENTNEEGEPKLDFSNGTLMTSDIGRIHCRSSRGETFDKTLVGIAYKRQLHDFTGVRSPSKMNLNVLVVGFDSISRMTAIRKYFKTRDYILNKLNGIELKGYNIVGDGTPQALIPILTGSTEIELPESRKGFKNAVHVDGHPFIWKDFKKVGYLTHYVEDLPPISIFNHRMKGFSDQPTDHYGRTYYLASESRLELYFRYVRDYINSFFEFFSGTNAVDPAFCYKGSKKHNIFLKMFEDFFDMYPNKQKFGFGMHSEISHDDNNQIELFDEDVYLFLKRLEDKGHLNNTMLIVMSDHGARFSQFRATPQGKLEERMPFFTFTFPKWFERVFPDAMRNFRINTKRLVTPFDIHATMYHMVNYDGTGMGDVNNRGISLFREIPKYRTCAHAFVEPHWCACLDWQAVDYNDPLLKRAIFVSISSINEWIQIASGQCHFLRISKITKAKQYHANSQMLKFKQSADYHGRVADLSSKTTYDETFYQITFITEPGSGRFEVTVRHNLKSNKMTITPQDVSRTNAYGDDPNCIKSTLPHLERFCKCRY